MATETVREAIENKNSIYLWQNDNPKGTIELSKDKQFIKCVKDNGKIVEYWYDLSKAQFLAHYSTQREDKYVNIKSITHWFTNCNIITYDYKFAKLILFNKNHVKFNSYKNPAHFIGGLGISSCARYEQWESIGIKIKEAEDILDNPNDGKEHRHKYYKTREIIYKSPSQVNKKLVQELKKYTTPISINELNRYLRDDSDSMYKKHQILRKLIEYEQMPQYSDLFLVEENGWRNHGLESVISTSNHTWDKSKLLYILTKYNIDTDRFVKYLRQLKDFEHTTIEWIIHNYEDYLKAEKQLRGGKLRKMDKYPSNLVQMHHNKTSIIKEIEREKRRLKDLEQKEKDKVIYESQKDLAWKPRNSDYCIIVPKNADDVVEEGNKMNHCVGSYIGRISKKDTFIVFMRKQEEEDAPYITVEVKNGNICTALGYMNRRINKKEKIFLEKYAKAKNLEYTAYDKIGDDI